MSSKIQQLRKQIKVKEAPKKWLVLDYWVESGPADFVSKKNIYTDEEIIINDKDACKFEDETGEQAIRLYNQPKETFGTKHIQLVAANSPINGVHAIVSLDKINDNNDNHEHYIEIDWQKANELEEQCKDFFIYKVTEEKDVK